MCHKTYKVQLLLFSAKHLIPTQYPSRYPIAQISLMTRPDWESATNSQDLCFLINCANDLTYTSMPIDVIQLNAA